MNSDDDTSELVDALRSDLPNAEQSARIKARLAALATISAVGLASASAAASTGLATTATKAGLLASAVSRVSALSWGTKVGLAAAVSASAAAGPMLLSQSDERASESVTAGAPSVSTVRRTNTRAPRRGVPGASIEAPAATVAPAAPPASVEREPSVVTASAEERAAPPAARVMRAASQPPAGPASQAAPTVAVTAGGGALSAAAPVAVFDAPPELQPAPPSVRVSDAPVSGTTLAEETALVDRAFAALRAGQLASAETLVLEHQRRFPNGVLLRERERARAKLVELMRERRLAR